MKLIKKIVIFVVIIILGVVGIMGYKGYEMYKTAINEVSIDDKIKQIEEKENYTTLDEMPEKYKEAVIAVEDHRFYTHGGIDIISIGRAFYSDIKNKELSEGGSTITQQLAKNSYFTQEKKLTRKIAETLMAVKYEQECDKDKILELYLNTSYFGDSCYSVKEAAEHYFDKEPMEMDLSECTMLAGIPNAPSVYAPTKNPELAKKRQKQVINKMLEYGYITEEEANEII